MRLSFLRFFVGKRNPVFHFGLISIMIGWMIFGLVKTSFAAPGDLDPTFGNGGKVTTPVGGGIELCSASVLQADGKIVVVGYVYATVGSDIAVLRYNVDGTLDTTFGTGGKVITNTGANTFDKASSVEIQSDGKIVVAGDTVTSEPDRILSDFMVVRYNSDGSLDTSFDGDGIVTTRFGEFFSGFAHSIKIQSDGKIVVAGERSLAGVIDGSRPTGADNYSFAVARYNANGSLDTTFDGDGLVFTNITEAADVGSSVIIQDDGKIVVGGYDSFVQDLTIISTRNTLVRYNIDGSLDTAFGRNGIVITFPPPGFDQIAMNKIASQPDGKIVGVGRIRDLSRTFHILVTRYNSNGTLDTSFDQDGFVQTRVANGLNEAKALAIQSNGKIIIGGFGIESVSTDLITARYNPNGALDTAFGDGGSVVTTFGPSSDEEAEEIMIHKDGKIIAAASNYNPDAGRSYFALARFQGDLTSSGQPLFDFDGDGKTDISIFRPSTGEWWSQHSSNNQVSVARFGLESDRIAPADFDGDGKTDIAIFRQVDGSWWIIRSSDGAVLNLHFGQDGDLPRPTDFDGDGRADLSVFRPSEGNWYRMNSSDNQVVITRFGLNNDAPLIADFDGDGKSDIAVWRPSNRVWYWLNSSNGQFSALQFGEGIVAPVPADFDGDGKADITVFRPETRIWSRINSSNGQVVTVQFGRLGDFPTVADFDGDGKADIAVWRPLDKVWYWLRSSDTGFASYPFGTVADRPVSTAFLPPCQFSICIN